MCNVNHVISKTHFLNYLIVFVYKNTTKITKSCFRNNPNIHFFYYVVGKSFKHQTFTKMIDVQIYASVLSLQPYTEEKSLIVNCHKGYVKVRPLSTIRNSLATKTSPFSSQQLNWICYKHWTFFLTWSLIKTTENLPNNVTSSRV